MNFNSFEKQIFKFFGFTKTGNDSKWTRRSWNKLTQPPTSNSRSQSIFPDHVHNQAGFDNPFINGRGFIYLGISKLSFTLQVFTRVQGSVSIKAAKKTNIWLYLSMAGQPQDVLL